MGGKREGEGGEKDEKYEHKVKLVSSKKKKKEIVPLHWGSTGLMGGGYTARIKAVGG